MSETNVFDSGAGMSAVAMSAAEIAALIGAEPRPGADLERRVTGIAPLDRAGPHDLVFLEKQRFGADLAETAARVCLTTAALAPLVPEPITVLTTPQPYASFVTVARVMFPGALRPSSLLAAEGRAEGAFVHPSARMEDGVTIEPGAVIGAGVRDRRRHADRAGRGDRRRRAHRPQLRHRRRHDHHPRADRRPGHRSIPAPGSARTDSAICRAAAT